MRMRAGDITYNYKSNKVTLNIAISVIMTALMSHKGYSYINILTYIFVTILPIIMFATILGKELVVIIFTFILMWV